MTKPLYRELVTRAQFLQQGVSIAEIHRKVENGELFSVRQSVFVPASSWKTAFPSDRHIAECYAWAMVSKQAVFSHVSAALLLGLPLLRTPQKIHCYCPPNSRGRARNVRLFPKLDVATPLVYSDQQLVCTDVLTTLNDCIRLLDVQSGLVLAESALHKNLVSVEESKELLSLPGRGSRNARAVVEQMGSLSESPGETLMMMRLRELKLPLPVQQYEMHVPWSGELFRLDAAYVQEKIALEFDGAVKMKDFGPADQVLVRERNREKTLHNLGWIVLRFSWETVLNRPAEINAVIRKAFHQRGRELR